MENERKHGFIAQVYLLILASMAILGVVTYISQYQAAKKRVRTQVENLTSEAAGEVILSIKEYPAWQWLLKYWYEHADCL